MLLKEIIQRKLMRTAGLVTMSMELETSNPSGWARLTVSILPHTLNDSMATLPGVSNPFDSSRSSCFLAFSLSFLLAVLSNSPNTSTCSVNRRSTSRCSPSASSASFPHELFHNSSKKFLGDKVGDDESMHRSGFCEDWSRWNEAARGSGRSLSGSVM